MKRKVSSHPRYFFRGFKSSQKSGKGKNECNDAIMLLRRPRLTHRRTKFKMDMQSKRNKPGPWTPQRHRTPLPHGSRTTFPRQKSPRQRFGNRANSLQRTRRAVRSLFHWGTGGIRSRKVAPSPACRVTPELDTPQAWAAQATKSRLPRNPQGNPGVARRSSARTRLERRTTGRD